MTSAAMVVVEEAPGVAGRRLSLPDKTTVIGRSADCDLALDDREVSRRHAAIRREGDRYVVADLGSRNGTYVNGERLTGAVALRDGDVIVIAPRFRIRFVDQDATLPASRSRPDLRIDSESRSVALGDHVLAPPLAPSQFALAAMLAEHPDRVFSRGEIVRRCYGDVAGSVTDLAVDGLVRRLRSRLSELDPTLSWVEAVRGHGFRLVPRSATRLPPDVR